MRDLARQLGGGPDPFRGSVPADRKCIDFDTRKADNPDMATHPADAMAHNLFGRTTLDAIRLGECIRCAETVTPDAWPDVDRREYLLTALCPTCWDVLFPEDDDE